MVTLTAGVGPVASPACFREKPVMIEAESWRM